MKVLMVLLITLAAPLLAQDSLLVVGDGMAIFLPQQTTKTATRAVGKLNVNGSLLVRDSSGLVVDTLPPGYAARIQGTNLPIRKCPVRTVAVTMAEKADLSGINLTLTLNGLVPLSWERGRKLSSWLAQANLREGARFGMATAKPVSFEGGDTLVVIWAVETGEAAVTVDRAYGDEKAIEAKVP